MTWDRQVPVLLSRHRRLVPVHAFEPLIFQLFTRPSHGEAGKFQGAGSRFRLRLDASILPLKLDEFPQRKTGA